MVVGSREPQAFALFATFDRIDNPPKGRDGGTDGAAGALHLASGAKLRAKGRQVVPEGDRVILDMPGGAGFGDPRERSLDSVEHDLRLGLVTPEGAERDYGVRRDAGGRLTRR